ncbi:DUF4249 domain-containing protein [Neolewinella antarctica]|uniref:DUF4249 domain-containing protein n=1 Tax=Neolewinella antarctica TaxID=442734 RepID=A0ABX0X6V5_9BACT|nr:DUF4249 domain-containing protein [Neolewinella antarctica]NJC24603.1 hypothetical protein [Neolewinella antarctica]
MNSYVRPIDRVFRFLSLLSLAFCGWACEEVIESPFELREPKLVLSSIFAPHQPVRVSVTATQPITGEQRFTEINDAEVMLFEGSELIETLAFFPGRSGKPGSYQTVDFHPVANQHYTLHASADGFTPVSAASKIPTRVAISSISIGELTQMTVLGAEVYDYQLRITFDAPPEIEHYYDLRISQQVIPFRVSELGDTTLYEPITKNVLPPGSRAGTTLADGDQASVLFRDESAVGNIEVHLQSVIDPSKELLGSIVAELRTVSREYYFFQRTIQGEGTVFVGILEPRVNSFTNVTAGFGIFAGYSSYTQAYEFYNR